jgi:hypothetical protein
MAYRTYLINAGGKTHTLQLHHNIWLNRRKVTLDEKVVEQSSNFWKWGGHCEIPLDKDRIEIEIAPSGTQYAYACSFHNQVIQSEEDKRAGKSYSSLEAKKIAVNRYWQQFGRMTGLHKLPPAPLSKDDRLWYAGYLRGRFVLVRPADIKVGDSQIKVLQTVVKCRQNGDKAKLTKEIKASLAAEGIAVSDQMLSIDTDNVTAGLTYLPEKHPVEETAKQIQKLVDVVSHHTSPPPQCVCESEFCDQTSVRHTQLVFINSAVLFLCDDCVHDLPAQYAKIKKAYGKTPAKLVRGTAFAICAAIIAAAVWAIVAAYLYVLPTSNGFSSLTVLLSAGIVYTTFKAYFKGIEGVQRASLIGAALAWIISMSGVVGGFYLFGLFLAMYHAGFQLQYSVFASAWSFFAENILTAAYLVTPFIVSLIPMLEVLGHCVSTRTVLNNPTFEIVSDSAWRSEVI